MIFKKKFKDYAEKEYFPEMKRILKPSTYSTYLWNYRTFFDMNNYYILGGISPTEPRTLRAAYERFLKKYEIDYINPHALRHTFCTNAIDNDCPINAVSQILGHSNTAITMNVYNHLTQNQINKTTAILNKKIEHFF